LNRAHTEDARQSIRSSGHPASFLIPNGFQTILWIDWDIAPAIVNLFFKQYPNKASGCSMKTFARYNLRRTN